MKTIAIIPAGGAGKRLKSHVAKQYLLLDSIPVLVHTLSVFQKSGLINEIILALPPDDLVHMRQELIEKYELTKITHVVAGGRERQDSVNNCLAAIGKDCDFIVVHDAVRPFVTEELIERVLDAARVTGAAVAGIRARDTIKETGPEDVISATVSRNNLWMAQTPQIFRCDILKEAYKSADNDKFHATDDAALVERTGKEVKMVEGSDRNIKITTKEDMKAAEYFIKKSGVHLRSGFGYDSHRFKEGRKLILGGVDIPFDKGLDGHSDADVLIHAICDALLGAVGESDIGKNFPDVDPAYKNISSIILLERVNKIVAARGFFVNNIDATVIMEKPKLAPHSHGMVSNIARALKIPETSVSVKAKTNEGMGFIGRGEGVAALAVATVGEGKR